MPIATHEDVRLNWRSDGPPDAPALLLLNSLGTDLAMWNGLVEKMSGSFRIIRMDTRGHGASGAPADDYTMDLLAADALAVLDAAGVERAHVCGLSMGGMIALTLALSVPERIDRVVVCNSSAEVDAGPWQTRAATVRDAGMAKIVDAVMDRFFSAGFRENEKALVERTRKTFLATPPEGYAACCMAISRVGLLPRLGALRTPTLVINGALDEATPPGDHGDRIAAAIDGAKVVRLNAGHISVLEQPQAFATAVADFLRS